MSAFCSQCGERDYEPEDGYSSCCNEPVSYQPEGGSEMSFAQVAAAAVSVTAAANPEWWERAVAGACSHGGHGWDGDTCSDAPQDYDEEEQA